MTEVNRLDGVSTLEFVEPSKGARLSYSRIESPVGDLLLVADDEALRGLYLDAARYVPALPPDALHDEGAFSEVVAELADYFAGRRHSFALRIAPVGTAFQREVWQSLAVIPYGATSTYSEVARRIGRASGFRAIGAANSRNPISIVVPCHRVIGADGTLTGYAGGLERKTALLELEKASLTFA